MGVRTRPMRITCRMLESGRACHPRYRRRAQSAELELGGRWRRKMARPRGLERAVHVAWALALHVGVPALIAWLPTTTGMRLRDFADFYPEQAADGGACAALLAAGGLAKLCSEVGLRVAFHRCL